MVSARVSQHRLRYYLKIYRLCVSKDEKWLVASDNLARLCFFKLSESSSGGAQSLSHFIKLKHPVFAMKTAGNHLICGDTHGYILVYCWDDISKKSEDDSASRPLARIPCFEVEYMKAATLRFLVLHVSDDGRRIWAAGAGDNSLREYDVEGLCKPLSCLSGHSDYVCELAVASSPSSLLSASADGTVRIWDARASRSTIHTINVAQEKKVARPELGKRVSALASDGGNFMVCGGGVDLGIWHMGSYSLAERLEGNEDVLHLTALMRGDKIVCGGSSPQLEQWNYDAKKSQSIETSATAIYSILETETALYAAGDSHLIDVYLNLGYVHYTLDAFPIRSD